MHFIGLDFINGVSVGFEWDNLEELSEEFLKELNSDGIVVKHFALTIDLLFVRLMFTV